MKSWSKLEADKVRLLQKNYTEGRGGERIRYIVIHHNGGTLTTDGCYDVWQTRPASAHYQVEKDGTIGQLVWDRDTAWHAANALANRRSISVEHANSSSPTSPITEATLDSGAHLVAAICRSYGLGRPEWGVNVYPHQHFTSTDCPGHIAGDQRDAYMARAQSWYDRMGQSPEVTAAQSSTLPPYSFAVFMRGVTGTGRGKRSGNVGLLQEALVARGYLKADQVSSVWDRPTGSAYDTFLREHGIERGPDGRPTLRGVTALMGDTFTVVV